MDVQTKRLWVFIRECTDELLCNNGSLTVKLLEGDYMRLIQASLNTPQVIQVYGLLKTKNLIPFLIFISIRGNSKQNMKMNMVHQN